MKLSQLLRDVAVAAATADLNMEIGDISYDSRCTKKGDLFVAMAGFATDGHRYIPMAVERGAVCVLCEQKPEIDVPYVQVADSRLALAQVSAAYFGYPAEKMTLVGVTGTNGKTTTTYLLKDVLEHAAGAKVGLIGTNQNMIGAEVLHTERTTPESYELQKLFREMADAGCTHVVMEVSSHALVLERVGGIRFAVGIFTNLTQDHLDFHGTMEAYCDAKALLFRRCDVGIYNADDPWSGRLMEGASCRKVSIGEHQADLRAEHIVLSAEGIAFDAVEYGKSTPIHVAIPGGFMVYNTLGVLAAAEALGVSLADSAQVLSHTAHVKGRLEVVPTDGDYTILIDYAHTPDALENVLRAVQGFAKGRVVAVFGCGGDRDRTKRPKMGKIAADNADFVIVTSDNPRTEAPMAIIEDILPGLADSETPHVTVENRVEAIHYAIDHAQSGDVIVLAGKGHEDYQEINHVKHHLDEREVVAEYLAARKK